MATRERVKLQIEPKDPEAWAKKRYRHWASWWSGDFESEGCKARPFTSFISGSRDRADGKDELSFCMLFESTGEEAIRNFVQQFFPDYEERFIELVDDE